MRSSFSSRSGSPAGWMNHIVPELLIMGAVLSVVIEDAVHGVMGGGDMGVFGVKGVVGHLGRPKLSPENGVDGDARGADVVSMLSRRGLPNDRLRTMCFSAATGEEKRGELGG